MVLMHKIKQVEQLGEIGTAPEQESSPDTSKPIEKNGKDSESGTQLKTQNGSVSAVSRRPFTRSQTSNKASRDGSGGDKKAVPDKPSAASSSKRTLDQVEVDDSEDRPSTSPTADAEMSFTPSTTHTPPLPGQYTFLAASPSTAVYERRGPRTRTAQPVPVPNLTKKSRGRRVPTTPATDKNESQKSGRVYICKVEDCGKCFSRGEHLKRHVRSIHTHEKPFKCTHPDCDKFFSRHDNLLQHQKVHKGFSSASTDNEPQGVPQNDRSSQPPISHHEHIFRGAPPRADILVPLPYTTFSAYQHGPTSPSIGFATNMAVSSLRTELPPSLDTPSNGETHYYQGGLEQDSPLMRHRPFPMDPTLRLPANQQPVNASQQPASSSFYS